MSGMDVITNLCGGQAGDIPEGVAAYEGVQEFSRIEQGEGRLVFFLNYGINDYMQGLLVESGDKYDTATYAGAMRVSIEQLQAAYPGAEIVVITPGYITYWENGSLVANETGGTLAEYAEAAIEVAPHPPADRQIPPYPQLIHFAPVNLSTTPGTDVLSV